MTKKNHPRTWHRRRRAKKRDAVSVGRNRVCQPHVETLEDRSLLSGITVADVSEGGFVQLDTGNLVSYHLLDDASDAAVASDKPMTRVRVNSSFDSFIAGSVARVVAGGTTTHYELIQASQGAFVMTIASTDLPNKGTNTGLVDVTPSTDQSNPVTEGGLVDLTPPPGDADPLPDPSPEKTRQLGSGLAQRLPKTAADSAASDVAVEGAGGRSQAFELAMVSDWRTDGNNASSRADPSGTYENRSAVPVPPARMGLPVKRSGPSSAGATSADSDVTTNPGHEAVSRYLPLERIGKASFVSAVNAAMNRERTNGGASDLGRPNAVPGEVPLANRPPDVLATHAVQRPDSIFYRRHIVLAETDNWTQGDLDWLTCNVHKGRQTHAISLVAAALVSLRSLGLYVHSRDENQVSWTHPREHRGAGTV